jgi:hypothetical protein
MRQLTANVLVSLISITAPPDEGSFEYKGSFLHVKNSQFDMTRPAELINDVKG